MTRIKTCASVLKRTSPFFGDPRCDGFISAPNVYLKLVYDIAEQTDFARNAEWTAAAVFILCTRCWYRLLIFFMLLLDRVTNSELFIYYYFPFAYWHLCLSGTMSEDIRASVSYSSMFCVFGKPRPALSLAWVYFAISVIKSW